MGTAAAEVIFHAHDDLFAVQFRILEQQGIGIHNHARCAESALDGAVLGEGILKWVQFISLRESFYGGDVFALNSPDRQHAGSYCLFVDNDSAGAAEACAAPVFGPGKSQIGT